MKAVHVNPVGRDEEVDVAENKEKNPDAIASFEEGRITVSVRVRPLNEQEKVSGTECMSTLEKYQTIYTFENGTPKHLGDILAKDPTLSGTRHHRFTFDHVYGPAAPQSLLYEDVGRPALSASLLGFNTCILAYGQTGSGKSYCMMGAGGGQNIDSDPGIIPRLCKDMFAEIEARQAAAENDGYTLKISVYVSYLEIYRERMRCLLQGLSKAKSATPATPTSAATPLPERGPLVGTPVESGDGSYNQPRVREHPTLGIYVEGATEVAVTSVAQVLRIMKKGNERRHTASTKTNHTSSRSHAIFTIQLLQKRMNRQHSNESSEGGSGTASPTPEMTSTEEKNESMKVSAQLGAKMNLVDLAGSERAKKTMAEGETLKEGALINRSLTALGIVVKALAERSSGKRIHSRTHIPYRDSTLTFLLKESLGGNSKTFMIATVSPSLDSYDETISTLRYADRAKSIVMKAFVNETAGDKRIRELENEVSRLREKIRYFQERDAARSLARDRLPTPYREVEIRDSCSPEPVWSDEVCGSNLQPATSHSSAFNLYRDASAGQSGDGTSLDRRRSSISIHDSTSPSTSASTSSSLIDSASIVASLRSELRRAEEVMTQLSTTNPKERGIGAMESPSPIPSEALLVENSCTIEVSHEGPYLMNLDAAGDWMIAHLGPRATAVGIFSPDRVELPLSGDENELEQKWEGDLDGNAAEDSSLSLSSMLDSDDAAKDQKRSASSPSDSESMRYVTIPESFGPGIGSPHCILVRSVNGSFTTTTIRAAGPYVSLVLRPSAVLPLRVEGTTEVGLLSGDVLDLGECHIQLRYVNPAEPPVTPETRCADRVLVPPESCASEAQVDVETATVDVVVEVSKTPPAAEVAVTTREGSLNSPEESPGVQSEKGHFLRTAEESAGVVSGATEAQENGTESSNRTPIPTIAQETNAYQSTHYLRGDSQTSSSTETEDKEGDMVSTNVASVAPPFIPALQFGNVLKGGQKGPDFLPDSTKQPETVTPAAAGTAMDRKTRAVTILDICSATASQGLPSAAVGDSFEKQESQLEATDSDAYAKSTSNRRVRIKSPPLAPAVIPYTSEIPPSYEGQHNVVFLGPPRSGKTTLIQNLMERNAPASEFKPLDPDAASLPERPPTLGVKSHSFTPKTKNPVTFQFYELGGLNYFAPLMEQLPAGRTTYVICFPLYPMTILSGLRTAVEDILCRTCTYDTSIILVGTFADGVGFCTSRLRNPSEAFDRLHQLMVDMEQQIVSLLHLLQHQRQLRPSIVGRFAVDNVNGEVYSFGSSTINTFPNLLKWFCEYTHERCKGDAIFTNGLIPHRCICLADQLKALRLSGKWCMTLADFKIFAETVSSNYRTVSAADSRGWHALLSHVQLLDDWGILSHRFRNAQLRHHVILDPQWLSKFITPFVCIPLIARMQASEDDMRELNGGFDNSKNSLSIEKKLLLSMFVNDSSGAFDLNEVNESDPSKLLRFGVISQPALLALLRLNLGTAHQGEASKSHGASATNTIAPAARYAIPISGAVELLELCDIVIRGHKLMYSVFSTSPSANSAEPTQMLPLPIPAKEDYFLLYPFSFCEEASAGVSQLLPLFLTGPFYSFTLNIIPQHFFSKLMCRLSQHADYVYCGPVEKQATATAESSVSGQPICLPCPSSKNEGGRGPLFWGNAVWLAHQPDTTQSLPGMQENGSRVLLRMLHHTLFLSFHMGSSEGSGMERHTTHRPANPSSEAFFMSVLESVREVVEEFPGVRCAEAVLCFKDYEMLLDMENTHPAHQTAEEAFTVGQHTYYEAVTENINTLERIQQKSLTALRTARTTRQSHRSRRSSGGGEADVLPLLRNFSAIGALDIPRFFREVKEDGVIKMTSSTQSSLEAVLQKLNDAYGDPSPDGGRCLGIVMDHLVDVLAHVTSS